MFCRQVDLVTEIAGPFVAGILVLIPGVDVVISFLIVGAFNFVTFIPQYMLLRTVYNKYEKEEKEEK